MKNHEDVVKKSREKLIKINTVISQPKIAKRLGMGLRMIAVYLKDDAGMGRARMKLAGKIAQLHSELFNK